MPFGRRKDEVADAWARYWAEERMNNYPDNLTRYDLDHIEGRHLDDCRVCGRALGEHADGEPCPPGSVVRAQQRYIARKSAERRK